MNCKVRICALIRISSGNVGSKHHFSNDGRKGEVSESVSVVCFVSVYAEKRDRILSRWVLLSEEGTTQSEHKHLNR